MIAIEAQGIEQKFQARGSSLHGGPVGFDKVFWKVASATTDSAPALVLTHVRPDGDQGFPGELSVRATYRLDGDSLWLEFEGHTTKAQRREKARQGIVDTILYLVRLDWR